MYSCLPQTLRNLCHGVVPHSTGTILVVLGSLALVVLVLEGAAVVVGTQQQILLWYVSCLSHSTISKQTISKGLEALRGALCVCVTELRRREEKEVIRRIIAGVGRTET